VKYIVILMKINRTLLDNIESQWEEEENNGWVTTSKPSHNIAAGCEEQEEIQSK
jgi:hypothetical protein